MMMQQRHHPVSISKQQQRTSQYRGARPLPPRRFPVAARAAPAPGSGARPTSSSSSGTNTTTSGNSSSYDDDAAPALLSAEERLQLQLRSLRVGSGELAAAAAATAAATADTDKQQRQQQQQEQQPVQGPFAAIRAAAAALGPRAQGLVLLNLMVLLMGSNWVLVSSSEHATMTDAVTFTALRFAAAAALFLPFMRFDARLLRAGADVGVWYGLAYVTQALALAHTSASRASLLSTFTVLAVPVIAGLGGERIKPFVWACAGAAIAGTLMLEGSDLGPPNVGDAWAVASAVAFALQMRACERHVHALPPRSELPLMAGAMVVVAAITGGAAAALHSADGGAAAEGLRSLFAAWQQLLGLAGAGAAPVPADALAEAATTAQELAYTSVVSTDLVLYVELVALATVSATDAAMVYSLEPVAGALMAYAFLGERWGPWGWAGGALILGASMATQAVGARNGGGTGGGGGESSSGSGGDDGVAAVPAPVVAAAAARDARK